MNALIINFYLKLIHNILILYYKYISIIKRSWNWKREQKKIAEAIWKHYRRYVIKNKKIIKKKRKWAIMLVMVRRPSRHLTITHDLLVCLFDNNKKQ